MLVLSSPALTQDSAFKIDVLAEEFWPYSFSVNDSPYPQGIFIDFASELLEGADLSYELHLLPWPRVMRRAGSDANQLIITLIRSRDRENLVHWVGPVAKVNHALYGLNTMEVVPRNLDEARNMVVATVVDDVASNYLKQQNFTNLVSTSDHLRGLQLLTRGRVDLYPGNTALIDYQCIQLPRACDQLNLVLPLTELEQDLYFAFSLATDQRVVNIVRTRFDELVASGRLEQLKESFLGEFTQDGNSN